MGPAAHCHAVGPASSTGLAILYVRVLSLLCSYAYVYLERRQLCVRIVVSGSHIWRAAGLQTRELREASGNVAPCNHVICRTFPSNVLEHHKRESSRWIIVRSACNTFGARLGGSVCSSQPCHRGGWRCAHTPLYSLALK